MMATPKTPATVSASISPSDNIQLLSKQEADLLCEAGSSALKPIFRRCALAVLNSGSQTDSTSELLEQYPDFDISIERECRGIRFQIKNAPAQAFVNGVMIKGIREHLSSVLRDILYLNSQQALSQQGNDDPDNITSQVFHILRNANAFRPTQEPKLVVCWGGHSIQRDEYEYTKLVGYELGLRDLNICTGCGPGAMKGPMKGATIGHAKQRNYHGRYIGITEPSIIAAESPNPIVNELIIMPDIEKRLEAFVRCAGGIIVFPGGAGTAEEILYILGILLHPANIHNPLPLLFCAPKSSAEYFTRIDDFIGATLGPEAQQRYQIVIGDPAKAASLMHDHVGEVVKFRQFTNDAYHYSWTLHIGEEFQQPFIPSHENVSRLELHRDQSSFELAANLRRAFSAVVAGNVKAEGIAEIEKNGPYKIHGDASLMAELDTLLSFFAEQGRMKIDSSNYQPCYEVVR